MSNTERLLQLIKENPDLPILPMVETEVVGGGEYAYWMGQFGECEVKEFAIDDWYGDGCIRYRDEYDAEDLLIEGIAEVKYDGTEADYEKAKAEVEKLWTKAIIVRITT